MITGATKRGTLRFLKPDGDALPSRHQPSPIKRPKRHVVQNACENCRASKVKCSGSAPCLRCVKHDHPCTFLGRPLQRTQHELENVRRQLENVQQELVVARQQLIEAQRDLTTSQLDLLASQQKTMTSQGALENVLQLLQSHSQRAVALLELAALQSKGAEEFSEAIGHLPPQFVAENSKAVDSTPLEQCGTFRLMPGDPFMVGA